MENVLFKLTGNVAILSLNKPDSFNSLDIELSADFLDKLLLCRETKEVRAIVVTGEGKAFCAGGNLRKMAEGPDTPSQMLGKLIRGLNAVICEIKRSEKPVIAAINGAAAGAGFSLAMACDLKVASEKAKFKQAYTSSALVPDGGFTISVPSLIGYTRAMELVLLDEGISADKALEWGLVNKVCAPDDVLNTAITFGQKIADGPSFAFGEAKRLINQNTFPGLESALENERRAMMAASAHPDGLEGIHAFLEKRSPVFNK